MYPSLQISRVVFGDALLDTLSALKPWTWPDTGICLASAMFSKQPRGWTCVYRCFVLRMKRGIVFAATPCRIEYTAAAAISAD